LLFELLRSLRRELADERGVPPFAVFGDAALTQMAIYFPKTNAEFLQINGVGEKKLERYGKIFIQEIVDYVDRL
jgi:ATP-dependent DNA helicase RecQ